MALRVPRGKIGIIYIRFFKSKPPRHEWRGGLLYGRGLKNIKLIVRDDCDAIGNVISLFWPKALDQQCVFHILHNFSKKLKGYIDKHKIIDDASCFYEAQTEEEFYRWPIKFKNKRKKYKHHKAFRYFLGKIYQSIKYFELLKEYWTIAKTTNRLERFFEELKRGIKAFPASRILEAAGDGPLH